MSEKWYAVYTKPRWEKKVADLLTAKNIEHYCPLNKVVRKWSDRKKTIYVPLFTSYVFIRISEKQFVEVKKTEGVLSFVSWLGKPAVIKDDEITTIKRFLNEHKNVQVEKLDVGVDDTIKITSGFFTDQKGTVVGFKNNLVQVALPSLGYTLFAEVEKASIEKIAKDLT